MNMIHRIEMYFVFLLCAFCWCGDSRAGGGPENLVIIVNADSQTSMLIANHYIQLRNIPPCNVIYLSSVPDEELTNHTKFINQIFRPIFKQVQDRNLSDQIDYIVYSADFPTSVDLGRDRRQPQSVKPPANQALFTPHVSINSLTFFATQASGGRAFLSLDANSYMRSRNLYLLSRPFTGKPQDQFEEALRLARNEDFDEAIEILEPLYAQNPSQVSVLYWLARIYAMKNDVVSATRRLSMAVTAGWSFRDYTRLDGAFRGISSDPEFKKVLARMPNHSFTFLPSRGFRSWYRWGPNGMVNNTADQGDSYILSTVLAATRMRGTSEREALDQITRSVQADGTRPEGTFYFTLTGDIRTKCRKFGIDQASKELTMLGYKTEIVKATLPQGKKDIVGLSVGTPSFVFPKSNNQVVAGAICENLTSVGGALGNRPGQTPLTEFIAAGAAGSSGTVTEPYAIAQKFPDPRVHVHYVNGCSLAEAFYQSVHGPFQLLIIGDALCQPWAIFPKFDLTGIEPGETVSGIKKLSFDFSDSPVSVRGIEFYMDGKLVSRLQNTSGFSINTADISDGYHELRIVAVAENAVETQGRVIVPFFVSNRKQEVTLERQAGPTGLGDKLKFEVLANCGEKIDLLHNGRVIATANKRSTTFEVAARKLGRGPVQLYARATAGNGEIYSKPVAFTVSGKISTARTPLPSKSK